MATRNRPPSPRPHRHQLTYWQRWISQPQTVWLRKAIFQLHLWSGIGLGLYVVVVSVTGSVLVFRNELYVAATRAPIVLAQSGPQLPDEELLAALKRAYPDVRDRQHHTLAKS